MELKCPQEGHMPHIYIGWKLMLCTLWNCECIETYLVPLVIWIQFLYGTWIPPATNSLTWIEENMFDMIFFQCRLFMLFLFSCAFPLWLCIWLGHMAWTLKKVLVLLYFLRVDRQTTSNQPKTNKQTNKQTQTWPLWEKGSSFLPYLSQSIFFFWH